LEIIVIFLLIYALYFKIPKIYFFVGKI